MMQLRDVKKPKQRILGLRISKALIPSLKLDDISDSDEGSGKCSTYYTHNTQTNAHVQHSLCTHKPMHKCTLMTCLS